MALILSAALALAVFGQELPKDPTLGLGQRKVVAMGEQKWLSYYSKKTHDDSTPGICFAIDTYAKALDAENHAMSSKFLMGMRGDLGDLTKALDAFRLAGAEATATGGTIDQITAEQGVADENLTLSRLLTRWTSRAKSHRVSGSKIARLKAQVKRKMNAAPKDVRKDLYNALGEIEQVLPNDDSADTFTVFRFMYDQLISADQPASSIKKIE